MPRSSPPPPAPFRVGNHPGPTRRRMPGRGAVATALVVALAVACGGPDPGAGPDGSAQVAVAAEDTVAATTRPATASTTAAPTSPVTVPGGTASTPVTHADGTPLPTRPDWLGTRVLPTNADGRAVPQTTPAELIDRRFATIDTLAPPPDEAFAATVAPLGDEVLARSTWNELCPVTVDELRYLTLSFWGFDGRPHSGELIVHAEVAEDLVNVFRTLYEARYPIEEMRVTTRAEVDAPPIGDGNNTGAFVCRAAVGGTRFSEHAYGLAVDINPFHNPYLKGDLVLPELAGVYTDRADVRPGMIVEGDAVVAAFDAIGWGWGGRWDTLKDYQHFSRNNR